MHVLCSCAHESDILDVLSYVPVGKNGIPQRYMVPDKCLETAAAAPLLETEGTNYNIFFCSTQLMRQCMFWIPTQEKATCYHTIITNETALSWKYCSSGRVSFSFDSSQSIKPGEVSIRLFWLFFLERRIWHGWKLSKFWGWRWLFEKWKCLSKKLGVGYNLRASDSWTVWPEHTDSDVCCIYRSKHPFNGAKPSQLEDTNSHQPMSKQFAKPHLK